jgi:hypothetical protein
MSIVLYDQKIDVPNTACFLDPPEVVRAVTGGKGTKVPQLTEVSRRDPATDWIHGHVTHTTSGTVRRLDSKSLIESLRDWAFARYNANVDEKSWTLTKDLDASANPPYSGEESRFSTTGCGSYRNAGGVRSPQVSTAQ